MNTPPPSKISLILGLFLANRFMLLLAFPMDSLIFYGDYQHYFNVADMARRGFYPFVHYWYEFPPIFPYLNLALYYLAGQQLKNYSFLLATFLLLVESGNLYLLYQLAKKLASREAATQVAWIYSTLIVPLFFWLGNFDALTTFFILLTLYGLITDKPKLTALALGLGVMVKYLPILLLATIWRTQGFTTTLKYTVSTALISLIMFSPFIGLNPTMTLASLQAQLHKSSYETVWALIDGNDTTGNFGPLSDHFDPAKATTPLHRPSRLPTWLTLAPFALLGLYFFTRPAQLPPMQETVTFTTLTFLIFILWSKGWSPQWQTFLIPLILLTLPQARALLFIIALSFINFLEWPIILSRGLNELLPLTILTRTLLLALLTLTIYRETEREIVRKSAK